MWQYGEQLHTQLRCDRWTDPSYTEMLYVDLLIMEPYESAGGSRLGDPHRRPKFR
jgi:hypothetical protein